MKCFDLPIWATQLSRKTKWKRRSMWCTGRNKATKQRTFYSKIQHSCWSKDSDDPYWEHIYCRMSSGGIARAWRHCTAGSIFASSCQNRLSGIPKQTENFIINIITWVWCIPYPKNWDLTRISNHSLHETPNSHHSKRIEYDKHKVSKEIN